MPIINKGILGQEYANLIPKTIGGVVGEVLWTPENSNSTQMKQWIDATDESSVVLNGGNIAQVNDKSGNDAHATQLVVADQPLYSDGSAGFKCIDFSDPVLGSLNLGRPTNNTNCVLFAVFKEPATSFIMMNQQSARYNMVATQGSTVTTIVNSSGAPEFYKNGNYIDPLNRGDMYDLYGGNELVLFHQRKFDFTAWGDNWILGNYSTDFDLEGEFYELLIVDADQTSMAEILKIEGYLAHKFGLQASLPFYHPYRISSPTIDDPTWSPIAIPTESLINLNESSLVTLNSTYIESVENGVSRLYGGVAQTNVAQQPPYVLNDANANGLNAMNTNSIGSGKFGLETVEEVNVQDVFFGVTYKDGLDSAFDTFDTLFKYQTTSRLIGSSGSATWLASGIWGSTTFKNGLDVADTVLPMPLSTLGVRRDTLLTDVLYTWFFDEDSGARDWKGSGVMLALFRESLSQLEFNQFEGWAAHEMGINLNLPFGHPYRETLPTFNDGYSLFEDAIGWWDFSIDESITLNGADVESALDISRSGLSLSQTEVAKQALYDALEGAIVFDGTTNTMEVGDVDTFRSLHEGASCIGVSFKLNSNTSGLLQALFVTSQFTRNQVGVQVGIDDRAGKINRVYTSVTDGSGTSVYEAPLNSTADFGFDISQKSRMVMNYDATSMQVTCNGVQRVNVPINTTFGTGSHNFSAHVGSDPVENFKLAGNIYKIVILNRKLNAEELVILENYLNS